MRRKTRGLIVRLRWWAIEQFQKRCPIKIPRELPIPPIKECPTCGKRITKLVAFNTGEGWAFEWDCENNCGAFCELFEITNPGWWPFYGGVWANSKDLRRIGIEEV